jgi:hypothetical protein
VVGAGDGADSCAPAGIGPTISDSAAKTAANVPLAGILVST